MTNSRMHELGTMGACGEIARRLLAKVGGVPCLRYANGSAVHAAVLVGGRYIHFGSDDGLVPVELVALEEACQFDFDLERISATDAEIDQVVELLSTDVE